MSAFSDCIEINKFMEEIDADKLNTCPFWSYLKNDEFFNAIQKIKSGVKLTLSEIKILSDGLIAQASDKQEYKDKK